MNAITPEFIPHDNFHKGSWLISVMRPAWYYFREGNNMNRITNPHFMKSVDGALKPIVRFLHKNGIKTTPSCAGHHRGEKNYDHIYDALKADEKEIRGDGLLLRDVETGEKLLFKNAEYKLPWTRRQFNSGAMKYQQTGVLGIRFGKRYRLREAIMKINLPNVIIKEVDQVTLLLTVNNKGYNQAIWEKLTSIIKRVMKNF
jgi:hypothetical protein